MNRAAFTAVCSPRLGLLALAVLTLLGAATAARAQGSTMEASVTGGVSGVSGDSAERARYGTYNGLRRRGTVGLFGVEYYRANEDTGHVVNFEASDLLGENRELDFRWQKPGDWKFSASYSEQVRHEPNTPSFGSDLQVKRTRLGVAYAKVINPRLQLDFSLSSELREGSRLFGIGMNCPSAVAPGCTGTSGVETGWALLFLPEPIDARHSQVEARLSYAQGRLRLSGGYYGSFYSNQLGSLLPTVPASLNNATGNPLPVNAALRGILGQPVALPPDNQAHQIDLAGGYAFTPTTRLNFKLGYGQALQNQDFAGAGLTGAPAGVANLGGRVDTTLAQFGLSARPAPGFGLHAKLRYDERDDKTPIALYNVEGAATYTNRRLPSTKLRAKAGATYQINSDVRGLFEADFESIDRGVFTPTSAVAGISALRQKTEESGARVELRRRMNEDFSGSISLSRHVRDGSNWLRDNSGRGVTEVADPTDPANGLASAIFMPTLADRERDQIRLQGDWQPTETLSLQLSAQGGRDRFTTPSSYGLRSAGMDQLGLDANYAFSESWSLNANASYGRETLLQARPDAAILAYANHSTGAGFGALGRLGPTMNVGISMSHVNDRSSYVQTLAATAHGADVALLAATGGLPDIVFRQTSWRLFGRYRFDKQSELRLDLVHQRSTWSDWTWTSNGVPFTYSDGTTIGQQGRQEVTGIALRYTYRWQ